MSAYHLPAVIVQSEVLQKEAEQRHWGVMTTACGKNGSIRTREHCIKQGEMFAESRMCPGCAVAWDEGEAAGRLGLAWVYNEKHEWEGRGAALSFREPSKRAVQPFMLAVVIRERFSGVVVHVPAVTS